MRGGATAGNMLKHTSRKLFGIDIQQSWASLFVIERLLDSQEFSWICEIGTGSGALSIYLSVTATLNHIPFLTIDNRDSDGPDVRSLLNMHGACVIRSDVFCRSSMALLEAFIGDKPGLLVCDGGDKAKELIEFGPMLSPGCVLLAHDVEKEWKLSKVTLPPWFALYEPWHSQSMELQTTLAVFHRVSGA